MVILQCSPYMHKSRMNSLSSQQRLNGVVDCESRLVIYKKIKYALLWLKIDWFFASCACTIKMGKKSAMDLPVCHMESQPSYKKVLHKINVDKLQIDGLKFFIFKFTSF